MLTFPVLAFLAYDSAMSFHEISKYIELYWSDILPTVLQLLAMFGIQLAMLIIVGKAYIAARKGRRVDKVDV